MMMVRGHIPSLEPGRKARPARDLFSSTRWQRVAIALGVEQYLHISNLYSESGFTPPQIVQRRDRIMSMVFEDAEGDGAQAAFIAMDANISAEDNVVLSTALTTGRWHDLGALSHDPTS